MPTFIRSKMKKYAKLGRGRKKKQVWRRPKGRHNKMRERRRGKPIVVKIGYGRDNSERKTIRTIRNLKDIEKITKNEIIAIGNVGRKKKIAIAEELKKKNLRANNIQLEELLQFEKRLKVKAAEKTNLKKSGKKGESDKGNAKEEKKLDKSGENKK